MSKLGDKQRRFSLMVGKLISLAYDIGYEVTLGDAWASRGHKKGSKHYRRLAIDLNLFRNGKYLKETKDHAELAAFWERIGGIWGGRFKNKDGNHYEL